MFRLCVPLLNRLCDFVKPRNSALKPECGIPSCRMVAPVSCNVEHAVFRREECCPKRLSRSRHVRKVDVNFHSVMLIDVGSGPHHSNLPVGFRRLIYPGNHFRAATGLGTPTARQEWLPARPLLDGGTEKAAVHVGVALRRQRAPISEAEASLAFAHKQTLPRRPP